MYIYLEVDLLSYLRPPSVLVGFLDCSVVKKSACNAGGAGNMGLILGSGRYPEAGNGNLL